MTRFLIWFIAIFFVVPAFSAEPQPTKPCPVGPLGDGLPATIRLGIRRPEAKRIFDDAKAQWKAQWKLTRLNPVLKDLAEERTDRFGQDERRALKSLRKLADQLRTVFILLDEGHAPPPVWRQFTRDFGKLNDQLAKTNKGFSEKRTKKIAALAQGLLELQSEGSLKEDLAAFRAAGYKSIHAQLAELVPQMRKWIENDALSDEEYHDLRKAVRMVAKLCKLRDSDGSREDMSLAANSLGALSTEMGDMRVDVKKGADVPVTPEVRELVITALDRIDLSIEE